MVILDSDHSRDHVLGELRIYGKMVTRGQYLIVEDTNINGHPALPEFGPGPMEALDLYLKEDDAFEIDPSREKFYMTFNPRGYLRRR
jgi:cephalosporin hydroxylase